MSNNIAFPIIMRYVNYFQVPNYKSEASSIFPQDWGIEGAGDEWGLSLYFIMVIIAITVITSFEITNLYKLKVLTFDPMLLYDRDIFVFRLNSLS